MVSTQCRFRAWFVLSPILSFWRPVHTKRFREIFSVVLWCSSQYWLNVMPIWSHSLSHNSIKCLLFILKFSFHYSTMVLLFKMFVHQMFVLPAWSTPYRLLLPWRSSILSPFIKRRSNRFFDSLNACYCYINIEFKTKVASRKTKFPTNKNNIIFAILNF